MGDLEGVRPLTLGRYDVYNVIGAGGMATVHLGRLVGAKGFLRTVAIKRLRPHYVADVEVVKSFVDEAHLAARVRHPNVGGVIDVVAQDGEVFLVMEYIEGESLAALAASSLKTQSCVPPPIVVAVVLDALRGLHAAHDAVNEEGSALNIVHRDVSPQNILVGADGTARVLDFGVAKAIGRQQTTRDGQIKGKLAYMAPEQLSGHGVTRRTDVFATGIVLWELLVGRRLFRADDEAETVTRVLLEQILPPSQASSSAPAALDATVMRALERDPTKRFATAEQMATALERAMTPATARSVGEWVRTIAADSLDLRARQVREIEIHSTTGGWPEGSRLAEPQVVPSAARDDAPRTRTETTKSRPHFLAGGKLSTFAKMALALALLGLGVLWSAERTRSAPRSATSSSIAAPPVEGSTPALPEPPPTHAVSSPVAPTASSSALPSLSAPPSPAVPRAASRAMTPAVKPSSNNRERLYTRD